MCAISPQGTNVGEEVEEEESVSEGTLETSGSYDALEPTMFPMDDCADDEELVVPFQPVREFRRYRYTTSELQGMGPKLALRAQQQLDWDQDARDRFAPLLAFNYEDILMPDNKVARIVLGERIAATRSSVIFEIQGNTDFVIKYQVDFNHRHNGIHPLLRDAWFQERLQDSGLVPRLSYISPPTPFIISSSEKTAFKLKPDEQTECVAQRRDVRFMVMQKMDADLYQYIDEKGGDVVTALEVMIKLFNGLKMIHGIGIVHGDIHPGNVGIKKNELFLFDWGLSFYIEEKLGTPDRIAQPLSLVHCLFSVWDLEGYRFSFRDDAFKVLLVGAFLMNGDPWLQYCVSLQSNGARMLQWKKEEFLFEFPGGISVVENLGLHYKQKLVVKGLLEKVLGKVRGIQDINEVPDYDAINLALQSIKNMIDRRQKRNDERFLRF